MPTVGLLLALHPRGQYRHMDGWGGWMWLNGLIWLLLVAALAGLVAWLVIRAGQSTATGRDGTDSARRILAERFARGEIDADEYARRRELLS